MVILAALSEPSRYAALSALADGSYRTITALARRADCHPDLMGRHLRRLRKAGLVRRVNPGEEADGRNKYFQIPRDYCRQLPDGTRELDYQTIVLRFPPEP
jgi:DNA-binding transcriptional ArsR family regulator